jgi:formylglycine-generating enzyme required for sulfatase activity
VGRTSAVGAFPGSAARWLAERGAPVHDLAGNVFEWCATRWQEKYPLPRVDEWGDRYLDGTSRRVLRGGSWIDYRGGARSAYRDWGDPNYGNDNNGFRCCVGSTSSL